MEAPGTSEVAADLRRHVVTRSGERFRALACVLALCTALAAAEVALRATSFRQNAWDPQFGWIARPGSEIRSWREGRGRSRWTDHGIRRHQPVAAGAAPIMVMGDSLTEALQVNDDETFCAFAEASLSRSGYPVPVLNAGRASRSPADYIVQAPLYLQTFQPRWTIVQVTDADFEGDAWKTDKTHFARDTGGDLRVELLETKGPDGQLRWRIYNEVVSRVILVPWALERLAAFRHGTRQEPPIFRAADLQAAGGSEGPVVDRFLAQELSMLRVSYDGRLTLLYLSSFEPRRPLAPTRTEAAVAAAARDLGIDFVSTRAENERTLAPGRAPYGFPNSAFNHGHLNPDGHRVAGKVLARSLLSLRHRGLL